MMSAACLSNLYLYERVLLRGARKTANIFRKKYYKYLQQQQPLPCDCPTELWFIGHSGDHLGMR